MSPQKQQHSMCMTVRVDGDTLAELMAETGDTSLSKLLNKKVKRALAILIKESKSENPRNEVIDNGI